MSPNLILNITAVRGVGEERGEGAEWMGGETQDLRQGSSRFRFSPGETTYTVVR